MGRIYTALHFTLNATNDHISNDVNCNKDYIIYITAFSFPSCFCVTYHLSTSAVLHECNLTPRSLFICGSFANSMHSSCPLLQVKIWFQNKRSKFKKLLKQGGNPHESDPIPGSMSLSPRSPTIPPIWDVSASSKGVNMPGNSYMPGYSHWYSSPHQDSMQR